MVETPFGNLLNAYRKQKKLTPRDLAKKADVSPSYISLLINGKKGKPRGPVIERLAQALELTEDQKLEFQAAAEESKVDNSPNKPVRNLLHWLPEEAGIETVHRSLSHDLLEEYFPKARESIRIQDNWLQDLFTYNRLFREMLKRANPGPVIQILLLDPECPLADFRQKALDMSEKGYLRKQINSTIELFKGIHKDFGKKYVELRLFDVLPSVQHIAFDETIFIGFNSHIDRSGATYQLQIKENSDLGKFFKDDFKKAWEMAKKKQIIPEP